MTRPRRLAGATLIAALLSAPCTPRAPDEAPDHEAGAGAVDPDTTGPPAAAAPVSEPREPFNTRVAVFMEATPEDIDEAAAAHGDAAEFEVIADDLMYYRAAAHDYLAERGIAVVHVSGRRSLRFIVDGGIREYDFADVTTLDVIVLFEPGREPMAFAPAGLHLVHEYFASHR